MELLLRLKRERRLGHVCHKGILSKTVDDFVQNTVSFEPIPSRILTDIMPLALPGYALFPVKISYRRLRSARLK